jgi:hypothetical protein
MFYSSIQHPKDLIPKELTAPEYLALDELAHDEELRFGACTPFEKELIRKDGNRVPVLVATAVLQPVSVAMDHIRT